MGVPLHNLVDTWSDASQVFVGLKLNVTDAGSASASKLMDFQINGISRFAVSKTGSVTVANSVAGSVLEHSTTAIAGGGGYNFRIAHGPVPWSNGPPGAENYVDDVWAIGVNVATPSARLDPSKPYVALHFESQFYQGGKFGSEFHLQLVTLGGADRRPIYSFFPHDGGSGSIISFQVDQFHVVPYRGGTSKLAFDVANGNVGLRDRTQILGETHNYPLFKQLNAQGSSYLELPFIGLGDILRINQPFAALAPRAGAGAVYPGSFAVIQPTTANANDTILDLIAPALTGTLNAIRAYAPASTGVVNSLWNTSNVGTAHSYHYIRTAGPLSGDPFARFQVVGASDWSLGIDNSDGDKFKISASNSLGSNDALVINGIAGIFTAGYHEISAITTPAPPSGGNVRIYADSDSSGRLRLMVRFPNGNTVPIADDR